MINLLLKIVASIGIILLSPLLLISILLIIIEDGFPVFFLQERLGKDMNVFKIYKIRTMYKNTPSLGTHEIDKSNYLKTGAILRKLKIDELPQVLNYIKGDLKLIGPRPGLPTQLELKKFRMGKKIFDVTPGISGLSQILGYDMSDPLRLSRVDALYVKEKSIKLDLLILIATFIKPFRKYLLIMFKKKIEIINFGEPDV